MAKDAGCRICDGYDLERLQTLLSLEGGPSMTKDEMFEVFRDFDPDGYQAEVEERWGDTDAYRESARRTKAYTRADWEGIKAEGAVGIERMVALFDEGAAPGDPRSVDVAEEARLSIDRDFYACPRAMHVALGKGYVADPRFTAYYDRHRPGLAEWFSAAIEANAAWER